MKTIFLSLLIVSSAFANISIITPNGNELKNITQKELTNLFLKKTNTIRGIKITPIDSSNKELYEKFYKKVLKKTPAQIREYWINQIYRGDKQPPKRLNKKEIQQEIQKNSRIITYTSNPLNGNLILTIK
jgi:hypothetical protein